MSDCKQSNKIGIRNFSNNCYLNVIIQLFLSYKYSSNIIIHYLTIENKIINPQKLLNVLGSKMNISIQNDCQEAFVLLLDLIPELNKFYENKIKNTFTCLECFKSRKIIESFTTFNVYSDSIEESIKQMKANEKFELKCDNCNKNTTTTKSCKIKSLGDVLVFHNVLKQNIKFTNNILYGDSKYSLTGIIKHFGTSNMGHYSYIDYKNKLIIDDICINSYETLNTNNIYLLFYIKVN